MFKIIAVTSRRLANRPLIKQLERIASVNRPDLVMLREKDLSEEDYRKLAEQVLVCCAHLEIPCILHTYIKTAQLLGCKSIHLPFSLFQEEWRHLMKFSVCGTSVHSVEEALWAQAHNAAYVTAGHVFSTDCKPDLPPRGTSFLKEICRAVDIPVYAIGGITARNLELVKRTGAAGACLMSEMMKA